MKGGDRVVLNSQKNFEDWLKKGWYLIPGLIDGLVVAKQHVRITSCPVIFSSIDFRVALRRVGIFQKKMLTCVLMFVSIVTS